MEKRPFLKHIGSLLSLRKWFLEKPMKPITKLKPNHLHSLFFNFTAGELSLINFLDCATENANASV